MINYNKVTRFSQIKYSLMQFYHKNKGKIYVSLIVVLLFLLTGLFTALKISDLDNAVKTIDFSFEAIKEGKIYEFSHLLKRFCSALLVAVLLFVFSLNKFTCILGYALLAYRAFLLSLNCVLLIRYVGIGGVISVIIIFPCQLIQLFLISLMFVVLCYYWKEKRDCGTIDYSKLLRLLILLLLGLVIINLLEFLLLLIFKHTTLLIL